MKKKKTKKEISNADGLIDCKKKTLLGQIYSDIFYNC